MLFSAPCRSPLGANEQLLIKSYRSSYAGIPMIDHLLLDIIFLVCR